MIFFNFALNCYYHHSCCSNKQSFKSEVFFSISIESSLAFLAVAFIFYCYIIVVKSVFNFYRIDLLSRNLSFIHISSVSLSLITFSTIWYIIFMLVSKFTRVLHFNKHNITKFLERFKKQDDKYKIIEKKWWIKLFCYCVRFITEFMKMFLHILIEVERSLKRRCAKNIKIRTLNRWFTFVFFWRNSKIKSEKTIRYVFTVDNLKVSRSSW